MQKSSSPIGEDRWALVLDTAEGDFAIDVDLDGD